MKTTALSVALLCFVAMTAACTTEKTIVVVATPTSTSRGPVSPPANDTNPIVNVPTQAAAPTPAPATEAPAVAPTVPPARLVNPPTEAPVADQPACPRGCTSQQPGCVIKGNISSSGEKIYHVPGGGSYTATKIDPSKGERWFCTGDEAVANGWRKARN